MNFRLKTTYLGKLSDDIALALVYSACDVFVVPSIEDNLPNTIMEAMACGTPCVGFKTGGIAEMIDHKKNGYLVERFNIDDLAGGISWIIEDRKRWEIISKAARVKAENEYDINIVAKKYAKLYDFILANKKY